MVNMHIILKGKKEMVIENVTDVEWQEEGVAARYYEDDIINLRLFPYTTINKFYFKEVE